MIDLPTLGTMAGATRTRVHALGSGLLVTSRVQSSSAVTAAAIGFVNAGLLALGAELWVLFGANIGTTMTGYSRSAPLLASDLNSKYRVTHRPKLMASATSLRCSTLARTGDRPELISTRAQANSSRASSSVTSMP